MRSNTCRWAGTAALSLAVAACGSERNEEPHSASDAGDRGPGPDAKADTGAEDAAGDAPNDADTNPLIGKVYVQGSNGVGFAPYRDQFRRERPGSRGRPLRRRAHLQRNEVISETPVAEAASAGGGDALLSPLPAPVCPWRYDAVLRLDSVVLPLGPLGFVLRLLDLQPPQAFDVFALLLTLLLHQKRGLLAGAFARAQERIDYGGRVAGERQHARPVRVVDSLGPSALALELVFRLFRKRTEA